jgi:hypothetical protein
MSQGAQLDESAEQTEIKQCAEKFELSRLTCALSYQDLHDHDMTTNMNASFFPLLTFQHHNMYGAA